MIDRLNTLLILIALALAFVLPFELFLFSYAVLGPLHYLTEIHWLQRRQFFSTHRYDYLWLLLAGVLILYHVVPALLVMACMVFAWFCTHKRSYVFLPIGLFCAIVIWLFFPSYTTLWFAILLPTVIHVFVFTLLFMWAGSLQTNSATGRFNVALLLCCGVFIFLFTPTGQLYNDHTQVQDHFSHFLSTSQAMSYILGADVLTEDTVFSSTLGITIARFLAFAYTYHYLNWFSKTTLIGWHHMRRATAWGIGILWALSVGLYAYDYHLGFAWLVGLSLAHVLLELPLNAKTAQQIIYKSPA